ARELDPMAPTSVIHSYFVLGDDARVVEVAERTGGYGYVGLIALTRIGRRNDALAAARTSAEAAPGTFRALIVAARALIEDDAAEAAYAPALTPGPQGPGLRI